MTIESGIIFGDFATLPSPVRAIRIVGRGKGMSGAKLRKKANRPTGRRHGCDHSRLPFASARFRGHVSHSEPAAYRRIRSEDRRRDGPRGVPHSDGIGSFYGDLLYPRGTAGATRMNRRWIVRRDTVASAKRKGFPVPGPKRCSYFGRFSCPAVRRMPRTVSFTEFRFRGMLPDFSEPSGERKP